METSVKRKLIRLTRIEIGNILAALETMDLDKFRMNAFAQSTKKGFVAKDNDVYRQSVSLKSAIAKLTGKYNKM